MGDRPILFSAPMVRALLAGTKTQTRRILNPQPHGDVINYGCRKDEGAHWTDQSFASHKLPIWAGDRLWARETWRAHAWYGDCVEIAYAAQRGLVGWTEQHEQIKYPQGDRNAFKYYAPKGPDFWRPSIFMPRWSSRITLIVDDVRVERLQDITEEDAIAEGAAQYASSTKLSRQFNPDWKGSYREGYAELWNEINGAGAWEANPWIVAYTFTVHLGNIDQIGRAA